MRETSARLTPGSAAWARPNSRLLAPFNGNVIPVDFNQTVVPRFALVGEPTKARTHLLLDRNNFAPVPTFIPFGTPYVYKSTNPAYPP